MSCNDNSNPCVIFVVSRDLWSATEPGSDNFGHVHVQLCWLHLATINKLTDIPVQVIMHDNPGAYYHLMLDVFQCERDIRLSVKRCDVLLPSAVTSDDHQCFANRRHA